MRHIYPFRWISTAPPSRAADVVFQNDFVFVQKVANAVGFRPVFIGARLFPPGNQVFDFFAGESRLKPRRLAGTRSGRVAAVR